MTHPFTAPAFPASNPDTGRHDAERRQWLLATTAMGCAATAAVTVPLVATVPAALSPQLSRLTGTRIVLAPHELPPLDEYLIWHPRLDDDERHVWFRQQVLAAARASCRAAG